MQSNFPAWSLSRVDVFNTGDVSGVDGHVICVVAQSLTECVVEGSTVTCAVRVGAVDIVDFIVGDVVGVG